MLKHALAISLEHVARSHAVVLPSSALGYIATPLTPRNGKRKEGCGNRLLRISRSAVGIGWQV